MGLHIRYASQDKRVLAEDILEDLIFENPCTGKSIPQSLWGSTLLHLGEGYIEKVGVINILGGVFIILFSSIAFTKCAL